MKQSLLVNMLENSTILANQSFLNDTLHGLSQPQKSIPCKWFYDEIGSKLFEAITQTPEYYPTRVETRLLKNVVDEVAQIIPNLNSVIEPGSGASVKTRLLLSSQPHLKTYVPIDISAEFLNEIASQLKQDFPHLNITPLVGDFTHSLAQLTLSNSTAAMVFFPGSTIGNFSPTEATDLLKSFHHLAGHDGWLLIGVDSTQDEVQLLDAYDDAAGITAKFNKNLLSRANSGLNANFKLDQFAHEARFNKIDGRVEMHLQSLCAQTIEITGESFDFKLGETIFTESCYKYTHPRFLQIAEACHWQQVKSWQDELESAFTLFLFKAK